MSNFYNKLKSPALFFHLFHTEKSAGNFDLSKKLLTRQLFLFHFPSKIALFISFQTRQTQLKALLKQMNEMNKTLDGMAKLKHDLHLKSNDFRRDLVLLLVGRSTVHENDFTHVIDQVVDAQKVMALMYNEQADADDLIVQLAGDYILMIEAAQQVLSRRIKLQVDVEREAKKSKKKAVVKKTVEESSEAPIEDFDANADEEGSDLEKAETKFANLSQTCRRELEHFDYYVMREEFEKAFSSYSAVYWSSLSKIKALESEQRPNSEMLALTVEPKQYEEMSAVSYHM